MSHLWSRALGDLCISIATLSAINDPTEDKTFWNKYERNVIEQVYKEVWVEHLRVR